MNPDYLNNIFNIIKNNPFETGVTFFILILMVYSFFITKRISTLTKGGDGKSLEGTIVALRGRVQALESYAKKNQSFVTNINSRLERSVQGVSTERFDPFENAGQQSFSTSLLNEKGDGVVISGIHSRDGVRVYAKEISSFKSERELSKEESVSIERAKRNLEGK